jgi:hypothetical protein
MTEWSLHLAGIFGSVEAERLAQELGGVNLMAKGLDLRPRLKTEKQSRSGTPLKGPL